MFLYYLSFFLCNVNGSFILTNNNYEDLNESQLGLAIIAKKLSVSINYLLHSTKECTIKPDPHYFNIMLHSNLFIDAAMNFCEIIKSIHDALCKSTQILFATIDDESRINLEIQLAKSKHEYELITKNINKLKGLDDLQQGAFSNYKKLLSDFYYDVQNFICKIIINEHSISYHKDETIWQLTDKSLKIIEETARIREFLASSNHNRNTKKMKGFITFVEAVHSNFTGVFTHIFKMFDRKYKGKIILDYKIIGKINKRIAALECLLGQIFELEVSPKYPEKIKKIICNLTFEFNTLSYCLEFIKRRFGMVNADHNVAVLGPVDALNKIYSLLVSNEELFRDLIARIADDFFDDRVLWETIFDLMSMNQNLRLFFMLLLKNNYYIFLAKTDSKHPLRVIYEYVEELSAKLNYITRLGIVRETISYNLEIIHENLEYIKNKYSMLVITKIQS